MRRHLAAAGLLFTLTACTTATSPPTAPSPTATESPTIWPERAAAIADCTNAVAARPAADGSIPSEPWPTECITLTEGQYLDAYMDGIAQAAQAARDAAQERSDAEASKDAQTP